MAAGFVFMWVAGFVMQNVAGDDSPLEDLLRDLHISAGVTLGCLLILRIAIRLRYRPPPLPHVIGPVQRRVAHFGHLALYALSAAVIFIGWTGTNMGGYGGAWFGIRLPHMLPEIEAAEDIAEAIHMYLAYIMLGLAVGHVLAALKHRCLDDHDVLHRMTFGGER
jgi:cytochrome b561